MAIKNPVPGVLSGMVFLLARTYQRLTIKHDAHVDISLNHMARRMRLIEARFGGIGDDLNLFRNIEV